MASVKAQNLPEKGCTARPKHAQKAKYPRIGHRTKEHVRMDFHLQGLDREITFSDNADQINLEETGDLDPRKNEDALASQIDGECGDALTMGTMRNHRLEFLQWAMPQLTDRQVWALGLYTHGASQYEGAAAMDITQPSFYETLFGKNGKGGAIKKLRKLAAKYPIALI
jgi:hypothetical protein